MFYFFGRLFFEINIKQELIINCKLSYKNEAYFYRALIKSIKRRVIYHQDFSQIVFNKNKIALKMNDNQAQKLIRFWSLGLEGWLVITSLRN